jgi:hypothetical protein
MRFERKRVKCTRTLFTASSVYSALETEASSPEMRLEVTVFGINKPDVVLVQADCEPHERASQYGKRVVWGIDLWVPVERVRSESVFGQLDPHKLGDNMRASGLVR